MSLPNLRNASVHILFCIAAVLDTVDQSLLPEILYSFSINKLFSFDSPLLFLCVFLICFPCGLLLLCFICCVHQDSGLYINSILEWASALPWFNHPVSWWHWNVISSSYSFPVDDSFPGWLKPNSSSCPHLPSPSSAPSHQYPFSVIGITFCTVRIETK